MERLRELRGPETRERDLACTLGFEHSRAVRWKEGQMYVDRAEYLVRLADALAVDTMLLVAIASGALTFEQAQHEIAGTRETNDAKKRKAAPQAASVDVATDVSPFALEGSKFEASGRRLVLLIAGNGEGRVQFGEALERHSDVKGLVATGLPIGVCLAERYRPELVFLELGATNVHAFEACRLLSSMTSRGQRRCHVVAGTSTVDDGGEKAALMAGAARVVPFPFSSSLFDSELDRMEERFSARKVVRR